MGKDSYSIIHRREKMRSFLIRCQVTSYAALRSEFDVSPKVICGDLDYIEDVMGLPLERKTGKYGYIKVRDEWYRRKVYYNVSQQDFLIRIYDDLENEEDIKLMESIMFESCEASRFIHKLK